MAKLREDVTWPQLERVLAEMAEPDQRRIRRMMRKLTGFTPGKRKQGGIKGVGNRNALEVLVALRRWSRGKR